MLNYKKFKRLSMDRNKRNYADKRAAAYATARFDENNFFSYRVSKLEDKEIDLHTELYSFLFYLRGLYHCKSDIKQECTKETFLHSNGITRQYGLIFESQGYMYFVRVNPDEMSFCIAVRGRVVERCVESTKTTA